MQRFFHPFRLLESLTYVPRIDIIEKMKDLFKSLSKFEIFLWAFSVIVLIVTFIVSPNKDYINLSASLIGVTSLIFIAKGKYFGQILMIAFALLYSVISLLFKYYGELITYAGMSLPMAVVSLIKWIKHKSDSAEEVEVSSTKRSHILILFSLTAAVTVAFYFILGALGNANLIFSTLSVATSFLAAGLTCLRNRFYALAYCANDVVLIVLWSLASYEDLSYLTMVVCFAVFLINDIYGFINWTRMKKRQAKENLSPGE